MKSQILSWYQLADGDALIYTSCGSGLKCLNPSCCLFPPHFPLPLIGINAVTSRRITTPFLAEKYRGESTV